MGVDERGGGFDWMLCSREIGRKGPAEKKEGGGFDGGCVEEGEESQSGIVLVYASSGCMMLEDVLLARVSGRKRERLWICDLSLDQDAANMSIHHHSR